jgi:hypothetical protein
MAAKLKKGDKVVVWAGKDKGKQGEVIRMIPSENRAVRGGRWSSSESDLRASNRIERAPTTENSGVIGFRVASVPEPSTYALLAMAAAGALWMTRRRR